MSGLDPSAALGSGAALSQSSLAALDLGVAIEILQAQLSIGDLITATVLAPQNGSDGLSLLGQNVAAQLPPGIDPGESLLLQVTAFQGNQIVVRNLGVVDPDNVPATIEVTIPQTNPGAPTQATLTTVLPPANTAPPASPPAAAAQSPAAPQPAIAVPSPGGIVPGAVAPSRAVFVAVSVQPSPAGSAPRPTVSPAAPPEAAEAQPQTAVVLSDDAEAVVAAATAQEDQIGTTPGELPANAPAQSAPAVPVQPAVPPVQSQPQPSQVGTFAPGFTPPRVPAAQARATASTDVNQIGLEARIAATRAASIDLSELVTGVAKRGPGDFETPAGAAAPPEVTEEAPLPRVAPSPSTGLPAEFTIEANVGAIATRAGASPPAPAAADPPAASSQPPAAAATPFPAAASAVPASPEQNLLARLRVPESALTLAAAKAIDTAASLLPRALSRLDAVLSRLPVQDAAVGSLRAALGFVQRLDPGNARALPEQLSAYVSNVIAGPEGKIASLIRAFLEEAAPSTQDGGDANGQGSPAVPAELPPIPAPLSAAAASIEASIDGGPAADTPPAAQAAAPVDTPPPTASPSPLLANAAPTAASDSAAAAGLAPAAAARVAERATALTYDMKAAITALTETPPAGATAELAPALDSALTAITGLQLNVLNAQATDPNAIAIPLPVFYHDGGRPVQLRISRDAPHGGKLDADNFHIAFILDTKSLGTVAVDLSTVGRDVNVNVKTQGATAASRFQSTLGNLRGRLEQLRYHVSSIAAGVAPQAGGPARRAPSAQGTPQPEPPARKGAVDMRA